MDVPSSRAAVYSVLFGLAVSLNVFLWLEAAQPWPWIWALVAFGLCTAIMQISFRMSARDVMSEHRIGALGAEE